MNSWEFLEPLALYYWLCWQKYIRDAHRSLYHRYYWIHLCKKKITDILYLYQLVYSKPQVERVTKAQSGMNHFISYLPIQPHKKQIMVKISSPHSTNYGHHWSHHLFLLQILVLRKSYQRLSLMLSHKRNTEPFGTKTIKFHKLSINPGPCCTGMVNCMRISLKIGIWDKFQSHSNVNFPHPMHQKFIFLLVLGV